MLSMIMQMLFNGGAQAGPSKSEGLDDDVRPPSTTTTTPPPPPPSKTHDSPDYALSVRPNPLRIQCRSARLSATARFVARKARGRERGQHDSPALGLALGGQPWARLTPIASAFLFPLSGSRAAYPRTPRTAPRTTAEPETSFSHPMEPRRDAANGSVGSISHPRSALLLLATRPRATKLYLLRGPT